MKGIDVTAQIQREDDIRHLIITTIALTGLVVCAALRYYFLTGGC